MSDLPSFECIVGVLARHIRDHYLIDEVTHRGQRLLTFHHNFSSAQQITAAVLTKLSILAPLSANSPHYVFICEPDEFERLAIENKPFLYNCDVLVLALIGMVNAGCPADELRECMFKLGLYVNGADGEILYTDKMSKYLRLYSDWHGLNG